MTRKLWNYKGLVCEIKQTENGWITTVSDIGLIAKMIHPILYFGRKEQITVQDVESMLDETLAEDGIKISADSQCKHLVESFKKGRCPFSPVCDDKCIFTDREEHQTEIESLEEMVIDLQYEIDELKERLDEADEV